MLWLQLKIYFWDCLLIPSYLEWSVRNEETCDHNVRVESPPSDQKAQLGGKKTSSEKGHGSLKATELGVEEPGLELGVPSLRLGALLCLHYKYLLELGVPLSGLGLSCAFIINISEQRLRDKSEHGILKTRIQPKSGRKRAVRIRWWRAFLMCYVKLRCLGITPKASGPPNGFSCSVHGKMCSLEKSLWLQWDSWWWDENGSSADFCDHRWAMTAAWPWTKAAGWGTEQWRGWTSPREQEQPRFRDWLDLV